jgi:hypothetical protein
MFLELFLRIKLFAADCALIGLLGFVFFCHGGYLLFYNAGDYGHLISLSAQTLGVSLRRVRGFSLRNSKASIIATR